MQKIGKCADQGAQGPSLGPNLLGGQTARHASTEVAQDGALVGNGSPRLKSQGLFKVLGEELQTRHLRGLREFSTKNKIKRFEFKCHI